MNDLNVELGQKDICLASDLLFYIFALKVMENTCSEKCYEEKHILKKNYKK